MTAELACIAAFVGGVLCWSLPEAGAPGARHHRAGAVVARLEMPEDRP